MKSTFVNWLFVLLWAGVIFYSSSQPYVEQDLRPTLDESIHLDWVTALFSSVHFNYAGEEISVQKLGNAGFVEFFIRKAAHFFSYMLLGFLVFRALRSKSHSRGTYYAFILSGLYAISDEIHQGFTPGRSPHTEDVFIDAAGALIGILTAFILFRRKKEKIVTKTTDK